MHQSKLGPVPGGVRGGASNLNRKRKVRNPRVFVQSHLRPAGDANSETRRDTRVVTPTHADHLGLHGLHDDYPIGLIIQIITMIGLVQYLRRSPIFWDGFKISS
jgi:hypothetical protein